MRAGAVKRLAGAAIDAWGRIDVWINNAGVTAFARIDEGSLADHRRVIETNLFGAIHGPGRWCRSSASSSGARSSTWDRC